MTRKSDHEKAPKIKTLVTKPLADGKNVTTTLDVAIREDARSVIAAVTAATLKKRQR
jgi:hypothetical protein